MLSGVNKFNYPFSIISGLGFGTAYSSQSQLGKLIPSEAFGRGNLGVFVKSNGNVTIHDRQFSFQNLHGKLEIGFTYNSKAPNADSAWCLTPTRSIHIPDPSEKILVVTEVDGHNTIYAYDEAKKAFLAPPCGEGTPYIQFDEVEKTWTYFHPKTRCKEVFNEKGQVAYSIDATGNHTVFSYDNDQLTTIHTASGTQFEIKREKNKVLFYRYDKDKEAVLLQTYIFDDQKRLIQSIPSGGNKVIYQYKDDSPRIERIIQDDKTEMSFNYRGTDGRVLGIQIGNATSSYIHNFDYAEQEFIFTNACGITTKFKLDTKGRITSLLKERGFLDNQKKEFDETKIFYHQDGHVKTIEYPDHSREEFEYNEQGLITKHIDRDGKKTSFEYIDHLLIAKIIHTPNSEITSRYVYDQTFKQDHAVLRFRVSPEGRVTEHLYDQETGLMVGTRIYLRDKFVADQKLTLEQMQNWVEEIKQKSGLKNTQLTTFQYDENGRLKGKRQFAHVDENGNGIVDSWMSETLYERNEIDQVTEQKTLTDALVTEDTYHLRKERKDSYAYHGDGELIKETKAVGTDAEQVTHFKLKPGADFTVFPNRSIHAETLNSQGSPVKTFELAGKESNQTEYQRDANDEITRITLPDQTAQLKGYDKQHQLSYEISQLGYVKETIYNTEFNYEIVTEYANPVKHAKVFNNEKNRIDYSKVKAELKESAENRRHYQFYDRLQRPRFIIDALNHVIEYRYDILGHEIAKIEYENRLTENELSKLLNAGSIDRTPDRKKDRVHNTFYDNDGSKIAEQDAAGYITRYKFDGALNLQKKVQLAKPALTYAERFADIHLVKDKQNDAHHYYFYDGQGRCNVEVDPEGHVTEHEYYPNGKKKLSILHADSVNANWNPAQPPQVEKHANDHVLEYSYDDLGRLTKTQGPFGQISTFIYDNMNHLIGSYISDGSAFLTSDHYRGTEKKYDGLGRLIQEANPFVTEKLIEIDQDQTKTPEQKKEAKEKFLADQSLRYEYLNDLKIRAIDPHGNVTRFYYDGDHQLVLTIDASGAMVQTSYNGFTETIGERHYATRLDESELVSLKGGLITPDLLARLEQLKNKEKDVKTKFKRNLNGQITKKIDAEKNVAKFKYTSFGQCKLEKIPTLKDSDALQISHEYDQRGNETVVSKNHAESNIHTAVKKEYNNLYGKMTKIIDENDHETHFEFDRLGRLNKVKKKLENGAEIVDHELSYDAFDRVVTETNANGATIVHEFLDAIHQEKIHHPDGTLTTIEKNTFGETIAITNDLQEKQTFTHAPDGKVRTHTNARGEKSEAEYDLTGRIVTEKDAKNSSTKYVYKNHDLAQKIQDENGLHLTTDYETNAFGLQEKITAPNKVVTQKQYNRNGDLTLTITDPDGLKLTTSNLYGPSGKVTDTFQGDLTKADQLHVQTKLDGLGRVIAKTTDPNDLNISEQRKYDLANEVVREINSRGFIHAHFYDEWGRKCFTYEQIDEKNGRLLSWEYDAVGNVTETRIFKKLISQQSINDNPTLAQMRAIPKSNEDKASKSYFDAMNRERFRIRLINDPVSKALKGYVEEIRYDKAGRPTFHIAYAKALSGIDFNKIKTNELERQVLKIQDEQSDHIRRKVNDSLGREQFLIDEDGYITEKQYDANSNVTAFIRYKKAFTDTHAILTFNDKELLNACAEILADKKHAAKKYNSFDALNRRTHKINAEGEIQRIVYDEVSNHLQKITFKKPISDLSDYESCIADAKSRVVSTDDLVTAFKYDAANRVKTTTDALENSDEFKYDSLGNNTSHTNRNKHEWTFSFDKAKRQTEKVSPKTKVTSIKKVGSQLQASSNETKVVEDFKYDNAGNVTDVTQGKGLQEARSIHTDFDGLNRKVGTKINNIAIDNVIKPANFDTPPTDKKNLTTKTIYDTNNQIIAYKDESDLWDHYVRDSRGRVIYEITKDKAIIEKTYDAFDHVVKITRYAKRFQYDLSSYQETEIPLEVIAANILKDSINDRDVEYVYDKRGNLIQEKKNEVFYYSNGEQGFAAPLATHEYDYRGSCVNTATLIRPGVFNKTLTWYDNQKNVIAEVKVGSGKNYLTLYERDVNGLIQKKTEFANSLSIPTSHTLSINDSLEELKKWIIPSTKDRATGYKYDKMGQCLAEFDLYATYSTPRMEGVIPKMMDDHVVHIPRYFKYDAMQQLIQVMHEDGSSEYTFYDPRGYVIAQTSVGFTPLNEPKIIPLTSFDIDAFGNTVKTTRHRSALTQVTETQLPFLQPNSQDRIELKLFDNRGKVIFKQDPEKYLSGFAYTETGKLARQYYFRETWSGKQKTMNIDEKQFIYAGNFPIEERSKRNGMIQFRKYNLYNTFGEYYSESNDGQTWPTYQWYDKVGRLWQGNMHEGVQKITLYDLANHPTLVLTSPTDLFNTHTYQEIPILLKWDTKRLLRNENILDDFGQIIAVKPTFWWNANNGIPTAGFVRDAFGNAVEEIDSYGRYTHHEYNHRNQLVLTQEPEALAVDGTVEKRTIAITRFYYNPRGFLIGEIDALGNVKYSQLDEAGRLLRLFLAAGTISETNHRNVYGEIAYQTDSSNRTFGYEHDRNGKVIKKVYPSGRVQNFIHDSQGELIHLSNKYGHGFHLNRDSEGNIIDQISPMDEVTSFNHDHNHEITRKINPNGSTLAYTRDYFGTQMSHTDLSNVTTVSVYDFTRNLIKEYAFNSGHGDRYLRDRSTYVNPYYAGWDAFPVETNYATRVVDIPKFSEYVVVNGLVMTVIDHAARRKYEYKYDSEGRPIRFQLFNLADNRLIYEVEGFYDERKRIYFTKNKILTATGLYTEFSSQVKFSSVGDRAYGKNILDPAGYGKNCRGALQIHDYINSYDAERNTVINNGVYGATGGITIAPAHGAILGYQGKYRTSEQILYNGVLIKTSISYDADGVLYYTWATNGMSSRRDTSQVSEKELIHDYLETFPGKYVLRRTHVDADQRELISEVWDSPGHVQHRSYNYYSAGTKVPYNMVAVDEAKGVITTTNALISHALFDEPLPFYAQAIKETSGKRTVSDALMTYNSEGAVNAKVGTADEYEPEYKDIQPITTFEITKNGMLISKEKIRNFFYPLSHLSSTEGYYFFNDINGGFLGFYLEKSALAPNQTGMHQRYHTGVPPYMKGAEFKPQIGPLSCPMFVSTIGKLLPSPTEGSCNPYTLYPVVSPAMEEQIYFVKKGDTLASIAAQLFGDDEFGEEIAKNNSFLTQQALSPGLPLFIPQYIANCNRADNYNRYHHFMSAIQGSILPFVATPQESAKKKHRSFFKSLVSVVIVGLALIAAWELAPILLSTAGSLGLISGGTLAAGLSALSGTGSLTLAAQIALGVASSISDAAAQGVAIALHLRDKFSMNEMLESGLASGLGAEAMREFSAAKDLTATAQSILNMGKTAIEIQLTEMLLGTRKHFDAPAIIGQMSSMAIAAGVAKVIPGDKFETRFGRNFVSDLASNVVGSSLYHAPINAGMMTAHALGSALDGEIREKVAGLQKQNNSSQKAKSAYAKHRERAREKTYENDDLIPADDIAFAKVSDPGLDLSSSGIRTAQTRFYASHPNRFNETGASRAQRWNGLNKVWKDIGLGEIARRQTQVPLKDSVWEAVGVVNGLGDNATYPVKHPVNTVNGLVQLLKIVENNSPSGVIDKATFLYEVGESLKSDIELTTNTDPYTRGYAKGGVASFFQPGGFEGMIGRVGKIGRVAGKGWYAAEKAFGSMEDGQARNLKRFIDKLPQNSTNIRVRDFLNGGKVFQADSPAANISGSFARYEKQIDASGNTVLYTKTTYGPNGEIIHIAPKYPAGQKIYPELDIKLRPKLN